MPEQNLNIGGEYYVNLAYKRLLANKQPVVVYPVQHFMQWGTPEDLAGYNVWSNVFHKSIESGKIQPSPQGTIVIPMADLGQRFSREGYTLTKSLSQKASSYNAPRSYLRAKYGRQ
ncbi:hypothetical protein [Erwinia tracheiphila]|uniref:Uncharacterized protein n=1 Tax=Erwinia tracheiphila TaxID=65700 RepID=A0A0M2KDN5_9GAMM|nr:hypothetical protein [Erwinia tracheiphila]EOS96409.1 hypothetical protein ETR_03174 [Erwinia tracheiphila PSU-1]KKF35096.1 hypothetical protein SY86_06120 [Erwinia tracheiphila]